MRNKKLKVFIQVLLEAAVIVALAYVFFFPYKIEGSSMEPKFKSGSMVFISHFSAWTRDIKDGDVIVCKPAQDTSGEVIIKRVIAAPGDTLTIQNGTVTLNGNSLYEGEYLADGTYTSRDVNITLGDDEYFVMGDNRGISMDSRHFGAVKGEDLVGKVIYKPGDKKIVGREEAEAEK